MDTPSKSSPDGAATLTHSGRANCHNCAHLARSDGGHHLCRAPIALFFATARWLGSVGGWSGDGMPPHDADGCPGFAPRGGA